jgi:hypothetical protein
VASHKRGAAITPQLARVRTELGELYQRDYYAWTGAQVRALREHKIAELDWENLAEEVEDLGKSERHRLESHLEGLLMHLLKWAYQPRRRSRSWSNSIREHRFRIQRILRDNPSLKASLSQISLDSYEAALFTAQNETRLDLSTYRTCPWNLEDVLRPDFWPGGPGEREPRRRLKFRTKG